MEQITGSTNFPPTQKNALAVNERIQFQRYHNQLLKNQRRKTKKYV